MSLTDRQFRHYFRMSCECYDLLCMKIWGNVGEAAFKCKAYLHEQQDNTVAWPDSFAIDQFRTIVKGHFV